MNCVARKSTSSMAMESLEMKSLVKRSPSKSSNEGAVKKIIDILLLIIRIFKIFTQILIVTSSEKDLESSNNKEHSITITATATTSSTVFCENNQDSRKYIKTAVNQLKSSTKMYSQHLEYAQANSELQNNKHHLKTRLPNIDQQLKSSSEADSKTLSKKCCKHLKATKSNDQQVKRLSETVEKSFIDDQQYLKQSSRKCCVHLNTSCKAIDQQLKISYRSTKVGNTSSTVFCENNQDSHKYTKTVVNQLKSSTKMYSQQLEYAQTNTELQNTKQHMKTRLPNIDQQLKSSSEADSKTLSKKCCKHLKATKSTDQQVKSLSETIEKSSIDDHQHLKQSSRKCCKHLKTSCKAIDQQLKTSYRSTKVDNTSITQESVSTSTEKYSVKMNDDLTSNSHVKYSVNESKVNKLTIGNSQSSKIKVEIYQVELLHHLLTMHKATPAQRYYGEMRRRLEY